MCRQDYEVTTFPVQLPRRLFYGVLIVAVACLGLVIRRVDGPVPYEFTRYLPDTLWALLVFALIACALPKLRTHQCASSAWAFAQLIECSQLYHAPWLDALRHTSLGGLVLGFGFLWSDVWCYTIGIAVGALLDSLLWPSSGRDEKVRVNTA